MRVRHPKAKGASERAKMIEREADSYESTKKKGQNDVGSEINEKIIIVTPASEMWLKNTPTKPNLARHSGEHLPPHKT